MKVIFLIQVVLLLIFSSFCLGQERKKEDFLGVVAIGEHVFGWELGGTFSDVWNLSEREFNMFFLDEETSCCFLGVDTVCFFEEVGETKRLVRVISALDLLHALGEHGLEEGELDKVSWRFDNGIREDMTLDQVQEILGSSLLVEQDEFGNHTHFFIDQGWKVSLYFHEFFCAHRDGRLSQKRGMLLTGFAVEEAEGFSEEGESVLVEAEKAIRGVFLNGSYVYIDGFGEVRNWDEMRDFRGEGDLAPVAKDGKWGVVNMEGEIVVFPEWDDVGYFIEGLAPVAKDGKWGFLNREEEVAIFPEWDDVKHFVEGLAPVAKDGKWGFLNKEGELVSIPEWDDARVYNGGWLIVKKDGKWGAIHQEKEIRIEPEWDDISSFCEELFCVKLNEKYGFLDKSGEVRVEPVWDDIVSGCVKLDGKWGVINRNAEVVIPPIWDNISRFSGELALVELDEKWGFVNREGEVVIEPIWDHARNFSEGVTAVKQNGKFGFIDDRGELIIDLEWDQVWSFEGGLAKVRRGGEFGYIDTTGEIVSWGEERPEVEEE